MRAMRDAREMVEVRASEMAWEALDGRAVALDSAPTSPAPSRVHMGVPPRMHTQRAAYPDHSEAFEEAEEEEGSSYSEAEEEAGPHTQQATEPDHSEAFQAAHEEESSTYSEAEEEAGPGSTSKSGYSDVDLDDNLGSPREETDKHILEKKRQLAATKLQCRARQRAARKKVGRIGEARSGVRRHY